MMNVVCKRTNKCPMAKVKCIHVAAAAVTVTAAAAVIHRRFDFLIQNHFTIIHFKCMKYSQPASQLTITRNKMYPIMLNKYILYIWDSIITLQT